MTNGDPRRGEIRWLDALDAQHVRHPHLVLDVAEGHALACAITSNLRRAKAPRSVLLDAGEGGLALPSVVLASRARWVPASALGPPLGQLSQARVDEVWRGVQQLEALVSRRRSP